MLQPFATSEWTRLILDDKLNSCWLKFGMC